MHTSSTLLPLSLFLLLSLLSLSSARSCTYDYECGNVPYGFCADSESSCTQTIEGFAISNAQNVYYASLCRTEGAEGTMGYPYPNYTFKRIPVSGGVPVDIYTRMQIPAPVNPNRILGLVDHYLFFDMLQRQPSVAIRNIDVTNPTQETSVYVSGLPQTGLTFDAFSNTPSTYACLYQMGNYTIERFPVFPKEGEVSSTAALYRLPEREYCGVIKRESDVDLFFATYTYTYTSTDQITTSHLYRGSITCNNCAPPSPFFNTPEKIIDFAVSGNYVFYGTLTGLYRVNTDGSGKIRLSKEDEKANAVAVVNGKVIYNNGVDIKSVDFQGENSMLLSYNKMGTCKCRSGFSGANCDVCTGQVQWSYETPARPTCVPLGADGVPTSCNADYQCGNPPFTACYSNRCTCFSANFTGSRCDKCEPPRQLSWSLYGSPICA